MPRPSSVAHRASYVMDTDGKAASLNGNHHLTPKLRASGDKPPLPIRLNVDYCNFAFAFTLNADTAIGSISVLIVVLMIQFFKMLRRTDWRTVQGLALPSSTARP